MRRDVRELLLDSGEKARQLTRVRRSPESSFRCTIHSFLSGASTLYIPTFCIENSRQRHISVSIPFPCVYIASAHHHHHQASEACSIALSKIMQRSRVSSRTRAHAQRLPKFSRAINSLSLTVIRKRVAIFFLRKRLPPPL